MERARAGIQDGRQNRPHATHHSVGHRQIEHMDHGGRLGCFYPSGESTLTEEERRKHPRMPLPHGWLDQSRNFLGLEEPWCRPDQAGIYIVPAPYEHTSSYLTGSREGPTAILDASRQVELYDETLGYEPYREWGGIATAVPVELGAQVDREAVEQIEATLRN